MMALSEEPTISKVVPSLTTILFPLYRLIPVVQFSNNALALFVRIKLPFTIPWFLQSLIASFELSTLMLNPVTPLISIVLDIVKFELFLILIVE